MNSSYENDILVDLIRNNLSTSKKFISGNATRNNFERLKNIYPDIWNVLKGKTVVYNGKEYSFKEKDYTPLLLNGIRFGFARYAKHNLFGYIKEYTERYSKHSITTFLPYIFNIVKNDDITSRGTSLLQICKKHFKDEMCVLDLFIKGSRNEREIIYRYIHNLKEIPRLGSKKLKFRSYQLGYNYLFLSDFIRGINDEFDQAKKILVEYNGIVNKQDVLKRYYPSVLRECKKWTGRSIQEKEYLYFNNCNTPPLCPVCLKRYCKFKTFSVGYHSTCSTRCAGDYKSLQGFLKRHGVMKDFINSDVLVEYYSTYLYEVNLETKRQYVIYRDIINPNKLIRSRSDLNENGYHIDHRIPKVFGFTCNIPPEIIANRANLQMLPIKENCSKGGDIDLPRECIIDILTKCYYNCKEDSILKDRKHIDKWYDKFKGLI